MRVRRLCMNKGMNKLLLHMVQYDLISGLFIALIIGIIFTFISAGSYLVGISVSAINFFVSGYVISRYLGQNKKQWFIIASYFLRMGFIVITMIPFVRNTNSIIFYIIGFITHYIVLIVFSVKNRKGSV
jgi:ATP synthase protein I